MADVRARPRTTQIALAAHVRAGDLVVDNDRDVEVLRVRRAQGRKPARGENLHLVGAHEVIKVNSLDGVRIRARLAGETATSSTAQTLEHQP